MLAGSAAEDAIALFALLGWEPATARAGVEHVCGALTKAGTRQAAYESLRRDKHARALLDIPRRSWTALLRVLLCDDDLILSVPLARQTAGGNGTDHTGNVAGLNNDALVPRVGFEHWVVTFLQHFISVVTIGIVGPM